MADTYENKSKGELKNLFMQKKAEAFTHAAGTPERTALMEEAKLYKAAAEAHQ